ncbi:C-type lectin protein [Xylariales sp. AK1849]|nr:C-type lectin protein [Xylariales sp. AK1849]
MPSATEMCYESQTVVPSLKAGKGAAKSPGEHAGMDIIDIRQAAVEINLKEEIHNLFRPQEGPRRMPTLLLYDEKGLQLFEQITYLEEYYLTNYEIQILRRSARAIAKAIPSGSMVVELGSGNLRKVQVLLQALEDAGKEIDYYALDLDKQELERTLAQVPSFRWVRCHGLHGTYDDGREWLKRPAVSARSKCVLSLGSSIGNFHREDAATFLKGFSDILQPSDTFLLGLDSCTNPSKVYHAYNDREGVTHQFIMNGLRHANEILESDAFVLNDWQAVGEYVFDDQGGRHQAFYSPIRETIVMGETIKSQERIQVEQSLKYSEEGMKNLWTAAGVIETERWMVDGGEYGLHLLTKPTTMPFSLNPSEYAHANLPTLEDWRGLWSTWDTVTRRMLPDEELLDKPIRLRNACIFYLGHIPTFLDIQLTKSTKTPPSEPASYPAIFERGIDPDVDNPELCHAHSEVPEEWPRLEEILRYQETVRARLSKLYSEGQDKISREIRRAIWVGFEHEAMHLETLLYMMLQSDKTIPPPHIPRPDFEGLARTAYVERTANEWFQVPEQQVTIGLDDPENDPEPKTHFGWDNEKPARQVKVHAFRAKARPITNEEYARYLYDTNTTKIPASWAEETRMSNDTNDNVDGHVNGHTKAHPRGLGNGASSVPESFLEGKAARSIYGLVPLVHALDWPIMASYDELAGCAAWMGGRIPTFEEARSIYSYVDYMRKAQAERKLGKTVPAVNGHLVNDGVEETPPSGAQPTVNGKSSENDELFIDLSNANVGFQHWHPTAVTAHGDRLAGQGEMGGVWEWTSSPLTKHEGFKPMALYPAYTADFFDGKHNIVLGGSWATHPRIAGRKSFMNWYQRNYLYAWVGARLVRDL